MFRKIITISCLLLTTVCFAQRRQIGDARTILLRGKAKEYPNAEKLMTDLLKDSANLDNKRIYDIWLQAVEKQYGVLNEQMYKKQKVDTTQLFDLTKRLFVVAERLDSIDAKPDKKGRVDLQYRKENSLRMNSYRPNLFFGGAYYVRKSKFQQAFDFFERYIDCARQPLFEELDYTNTDSRMGEAAYWATYCGYRMNDPVLTLRYSQLAERDTAKLEHTLQYVAESWRQLKDDSLYRASLWKGFRAFPKSVYFFPRLMDSYTLRGNYREANKVADEALAKDSLDELFLLAKSNVMLNLGKYAECLKYTERLMEVNSEMADAYFNAGTACVNIATRMDSRKYKKQIKKMYQRAMPYMETYRKMAPQETQKWAPALYRIYFNLNMGKQFDEIDKILKK